MKNYIDYVWNNLVGSETNILGSLYNKHREEITRSAKLMNEKYPVDNKIFYRGIILSPSELGKGMILNPLRSVKQLSFSEDLDVALDFANTESDLATYIMRQEPDCKGYLIEHKANLDEILFHHSWLDVLGLDMTLDSGLLNLIRKQKEVILEQRMMPFRLKKI